MSIELVASNLRFAARYYYTFKSSTKLTVVVLRGQNPPKITGGQGGWEIVPRRRRKGLTSWTGRDPVSMDVPILFDGHGLESKSVDQDVANLRGMANGDNFVIPPTVTIDGSLPIVGATWVIQDIQWGDDVKWEISAEGDDIRTRQDAVVQLLQYVEEDVVNVLNPDPLPGLYITREGDTLKTIAKAVYDDASLWTVIRDSNPNLPTKDPNRPMRAGIPIRYPLNPKSRA